jgi:hypothetical protein
MIKSSSSFCIVLDDQLYVALSEKGYLDSGTVEMKGLM